MRVLVEDLLAFQAVRYLDLAAYLRSRGWREVQADSVSAAWDAPDGTLTDVLLPKKTTWRDYAKRIRDVIRTLGEFEKRSEELILRDIAHVKADVIRLHAAALTLQDGTMSFLDALDLSTAGRGMLLASACAAEEPRRAYPARKPKRAIDFVDALKIGQSERGSYVFTILSAVPPSLERQENLPMDGATSTTAEDPFARKVTKLLASNLPRLVNAAEQGISTGSLEGFEAAVSDGLSADLCESVARLPRRIDSVSIGITWAPTRPSSVPSSVVTFTPDILEVVEEAGRRLREYAPVEDFSLTGPVFKVDRDEQEKRGTVQVLGNIDGRPRKVSVELAGDAWDQAYQALDSRVFLSCTGELIKAGKSFSLVNPRSVSLLTPES